MTRFPKWSLVATVVVAAAVMAVNGSQPTLAQGPGPGQGRPSIDAQAFNACTTTDYTSIVAKALNLTPADLRKDVVNGQPIQDIASAANVDLQTVVAAVQTARKAEIDQAVKDGVVTQDEANVMETPPNPPGTAPAPSGTRQAPPAGAGGGFGNPRAVQFPDISTIRNQLQQLSGTQPANGNGPRGGGFGGFGGGFGLNIGTFNLVKQYAVAAQALNLKCADLVKTLITPPGKSIAMLATDQKVDLQTVSDALTKAYKDALAQDVTDAIITQAQADQLSPNVDAAAAAFVNNPLPMGPQATQQAAQ